MGTPIIERERRIRIAYNHAQLAQLIDPRDYPLLQPVKPARRERQPKPPPPPRSCVPRGAKAEAKTRLAAIALFENSGPQGERRRMSKANEKPVVSNMREFLTSYCSYSASDPDPLEATLSVLTTEMVGLRDILLMEETDEIKLTSRLERIIPTAKPVEIDRLVRGLNNWRRDQGMSTGSR
jgi:hypothetical protein